MKKEEGNELKWHQLFDRCEICNYPQTHKKDR